VNFATSKNLIVKSMMFPHRNIHKFTWTSPDGNTQPNWQYFDRWETAFKYTWCPIVQGSRLWYWPRSGGGKKTQEFVWRGSISRN
jgi:hypothetical protein